VGDYGDNNGSNFPDILQFIGTILVTAGDVITVFGQALAFEQDRQDQIQSQLEKQEQQRQQQEMQDQIDEMQDQINQLLKQLEKQPSRNGKNQRT
jgi:Tfp pilus assembly protein PilO